MFEKILDRQNFKNNRFYRWSHVFLIILSKENCKKHGSIDKSMVLKILQNQNLTKN